MDAILPLAVWLSIILAVLGLVAIAAFGLRSLSYGKVNALSVVIIAAPIVLVLILGLVMGEWDRAAIWTTVIMAGIALIGLAVYGVRSILGI
jgi:hypothetical protein